MIVEMELNDIIETAENIIVYNSSIVTTYSRNSLSYSSIMKAWLDMTKDSREMPAYGVSLNDETVKAKKDGVWVEFVFDSLKRHGDMPFERLLVNVEKQWYGFNIIRYNSSNGYDGRCYYFDLAGNDTTDFYNFLANL